MEIKSFKDLLVWQKAMDLAEETYRIVKLLPKDETFALSNQMRRSAISIPSNIAEGQSRHGIKEYINYPNSEQTRIANYLSSLGVNLVIGHHPHVVQPVTYINNTLVIYSLGNFISNQLSIGLNQGIGLMVGMDIVVNEGKVTFENLDYKLLYTYSTSYNTNYKVYPFDNLTDDILYNHEAIEEEYMNIVTNEVIYD